MTKNKIMELVEEMIRDGRKVELESYLGPEEKNDYLEYQNGSFFYVIGFEGSYEKLSLEEVVKRLEDKCFNTPAGCNNCRFGLQGQCIN